VMGVVTAVAAKATGLKIGTPIIAGGGDGQCAGTGANFFDAGRAYLNLGTGAVSGSFGLTPAIDPAFRTLIAASESGYAYETVIRTGTFLVNWMVEKLFNLNPAKSAGVIAELEKAANLSPIGARGLSILPYWSGCMTPYWDANARGVIAGLSGDHQQGDIYRAMLEGVALEQAMMTKRAEAATGEISHFAIMGGGSRSDLWCQIMADATARDVKRLDTAEASALGVAMLAAKGVGWFTSIPQAAAQMSGKPVKTFRPRKKQSTTYQELGQIYSELWPQISAWNSKMQEFTRKQT
jgi:sugar (pentulose or hexulose) kinase